MQTNERKFQRLSSSFNLRVIVPESGLHLIGFVTGRVRNVSANGVLFICDQPLELGTELQLKFLKPNSFEFFEGTAIVVRVRPPQGGSGYEIGAQFLELTAEDETGLDYLLSL